MSTTLAKTRKRPVPLEVLDLPPKEKSMPWHVYQREQNWKLLIPGWGGSLSEEELSFIVEHLENNAGLRLWWGMKGSWKRVPLEVVRRIALSGSEDSQSHNRRLARPRQQTRAAA